ncbi:uncharacterized protein LACBIDRAFT_303028 [Laccaria bicolor S238N-H82]|uniref:Predicted protein n=1 Tax=Laccaria bicolor (strain S238N-H82 / ATCC MYA-4686) TaxID=486041 RepID=B0DIS9_LACBS|nr:uncharacterized protein LACBIDRAFT_303028 [Laccaria bicolor S238N-H82]EDR05285.1 predicted protein [Laccaria bicolor S238N-H82]|eukprot:XP_001883843.1 predicted protein [Laccaria bicolor S238N-H82]
MHNPVFSIAHMREMVPIFYEVTHRLRDSISKKVGNGPQEIDVVPWMARTALELIGQSGFGHSFDTLAEDTAHSSYSAAIKQLGPVLLRFAFIRSYFWWLANVGTPKMRRFVVNLLPWKSLHDVRDIVDTIYNTSLNIFESKNRALLDGDEAVARQVGEGKDILLPLTRRYTGK